MTWKQSSIVAVAIVAITACSEDDDKKADSDACAIKQQGDIYLGALFPYTGDWSVGAGFERGMLLALQEINNGGGIDGKTLGAITCNTDGDQTQGTERMKYLGEHPDVGAVVGPGRSVVTVGTGAGDTAAAAEAIRTGTLMVSPSATSPLIKSLDDDGFVFRTTVSDAIQGVILAKIAEREGFGKVFVVQKEGDAYTVGIREEFIKAFDNGGTHRADYTTFALDQEDFANQALDAADNFEADAILLSAFTTNGAAIMKLGASRNWKSGKAPKWMMPDGMKEDGLITRVADNALLENNILGTSPAAPTGSDYETYAAAFKSLFNTEPDVFSMNTYDAVYLIAAAMVLASDPTSGEELKATILKTQPGDGIKQFHPGEWTAMLAELKASGKVDYEGASGNINFDQYGEVLSNIAEWTIQGGAIVAAANSCWLPTGIQCP